MAEDDFTPTIGCSLCSNVPVWRETLGSMKPIGEEHIT
jgi:hypothetical protein